MVYTCVGYSLCLLIVVCMWRTGCQMNDVDSDAKCFEGLSYFPAICAMMDCGVTPSRFLAIAV